MAKPLDKRVTAILKGLGLTKEESLWDCHGTWVMYHRYIEIAGVKKKISIDDLSEIETNSEKGIVVIKCKASLDKMKVITYEKQALRILGMLIHMLWLRRGQ